MKPAAGQAVHQGSLAGVWRPCQADCQRLVADLRRKGIVSGLYGRNFHSNDSSAHSDPGCFSASESQSHSAYFNNEWVAEGNCLNDAHFLSGGETEVKQAAALGIGAFKCFNRIGLIACRVEQTHNKTAGSQ